MADKYEPIFKCPNDLKINIKKSNGEVVIDEECCTAVSVILKNSGEMATSFFGAYNAEVIKVLEKAIKVYFKGVKKTLKKESKANSPEEIKVIEKDLPDKDKWVGQPVPEKEQESDNKTKVSTKTRATEQSQTRGVKTISKKAASNKTSKASTKCKK